MATRAIELYATKFYVEGYPKSRQAVYRYLLLESEKNIEYFGRIQTVPCFGIQIIREDLNEDSTYSITSDEIECMTVYRYKVVQLIKKLYDNCVSPVHLLDIAGPITDEWVSDFDDPLNDSQAQ